MIYPYNCPACGHTWDVVKSVTMIDAEEQCEQCRAIGVRTIANSTSFYGADDWNKEYYSNTFGCVVRNKKHRKQLAHKHNVEEVGNDFGSGEAMQKHFDERLQRKLDARWEKY